MMKTLKLFITSFIILISVLQARAQFPMQAMAKYAGDWQAEYIMWMDTTAESMSFPLTVHRDMIMNNLFMTSRYTGTVMEMAYDGINTIGYDLKKGTFQSVWIDNMNSNINYLEGKPSTDGKSIEFKGIAGDAIPGKNIQYREVITFTDDTHQRIEMYKMTNGREYKTIEIILAKK
ncbi:MAG: DUF1579 family protein [Chitinophagales bacterium]|nr:DUF1579 family protein [Chitinophagales bacterium]